ncbi:unnamed protein product [Rotaria sordida]|uniref:Uncharacterized protein n=2 Tax=Rotaria sordida TaxID=392033 RepID=A0A819XH88_9BILA|nr:unnamed protein product [Rotaria sordida]CAF4140416.1 unnamed protein product [Rotaria sordida]
MSQIKDSMNTMLNRYKDFYCGKKKQIELIDKFENAYTSNRTIDWYTKESFLYKVVNRTFRIDDITLWYPFRCYIIDLCKQLEQVHKEQNIQTNLNLYRGQSYDNTVDDYYHTIFEMSKRILLNGDYIRVESVKILADSYNKQDEKQEGADFCKKTIVFL